jgi:SHS2 domain-containing protein
MSSKLRNSAHPGRGWSHFAHGAEIGVRGEGQTREEAFEHAALALTGFIVDPVLVRPASPVRIECVAPDDELLLVDWLNALIYEMATRQMLFGRFEVRLAGHALDAVAWGEPVDVVRHQPAAEIKGASRNGLKVARHSSGVWSAECSVDV